MGQYDTVLTVTLHKMHLVLARFLTLLIAYASLQRVNGESVFKYPDILRDETVIDDYHGTKVKC